MAIYFVFIIFILHSFSNVCSEDTASPKKETTVIRSDPKVISSSKIVKQSTNVYSTKKTETVKPPGITKNRSHTRVPFSHPETKELMTSNIGAQTEKWTNSSNRAAHELLGHYYHGCIFYSPSNKSDENMKLWPKVIPYKFDNEVIHSSGINTYPVIHTFKEIERETKSCLTFVPFDPEKHKFSMNFTTLKEGCYVTRVGFHENAARNGEINLQMPNCFTRNTVPHEIMHTLGFNHEHQRPDRDKYVKILWENVQEHAKSAFKIIPHMDVKDAYDYSSVMHFSSYAGSKNNLRTIVKLNNNETIQPTSYWLSKGDFKKIVRIYSCDVPQDSSTHSSKTRKSKKSSKSSSKVQFVENPLLILFLVVSIIITYA